MKDIRILVADDEKEIRDLIHKYLQRELYTVDTAADGEEALRLFEQHRYNLVILDLMMPRVDGIEVCRRLRQSTNVPILMLTAKDQEVDKIVGLGVGADDYVTKPFSIHELVARIKAHLRRFFVLGSERGNQEEPLFLRYEGLTIDLKKYAVTKAGTEVSLTAKEFELLKFLAAHPEQVFTKTQIFRHVWDSDYVEDDNTVMVHIRKLRMKIEEDPSDPKWVQTVWGIGYKFVGEKNET
ncbi:response regulator transcription factor [Paenibacillus sp. ACRRX]|uniref:response regulator transcription factor n=1 Tax=unclassified Paenibacillus TaxID=185978 RepID=UPI001EF73B5A|nr:MULTISPECIES: response regulator transcription factor [unclassified Paenibacillus]MCG7408602.1 response regulator transcription factor [Paenibacillus sp. ACRRX]MDK8182847.1 response regulator transcription factor [Paenibacillus sp. UMB4589-SE434]